MVSERNSSGALRLDSPAPNKIKQSLRRLVAIARRLSVGGTRFANAPFLAHRQSVKNRRYI